MHFPGSLSNIQTYWKYRQQQQQLKQIQIKIFRVDKCMYSFETDIFSKTFWHERLSAVKGLVHVRRTMQILHLIKNDEIFDFFGTVSSRKKSAIMATTLQDSNLFLVLNESTASMCWVIFYQRFKFILNASENFFNFIIPCLYRVFNLKNLELCFVGI